MFSSIRSTVRRRVVVAAAGTAVVLAAGGGATAAFAASGDSSPTTATPTAACMPHLRAVLRGGVPAQLRADLKTLRGEPKADRAAERAKIRENALSGEYGTRVERLAHIVAGSSAKGHGWAKALPASLRSDLKALRALPAKSDARKEKAQEIVQKAIGGGYGATIQTRAKAVQAKVQARCDAKASQS
ncbi:hypothetical protein [Amnibacterium endophyticum]|uniref:Uncharacterized protein n=1 Tax=Amnibacterium endophyticum TaxID=2109337 RepID=A0ABW4LJT4_9MICO